jgi:hypothetical protein
VIDVLRELGDAVGDDGAVSRVDASGLQVSQTLQRPHVVAEAPVGRRDHDRSEPGDDVAGEDRSLVREMEAEVIGGVPGSVQSTKRCFAE